jgi:hypothetical protein
MIPIVLVCNQYKNTPEEIKKIESGKYLVIKKDGKKYIETFNGTGWAYNNNEISYFYKPKL